MIVIVHQSLAYDKREFGFKGTDSATSRNNFDLLKYTWHSDFYGNRIGGKEITHSDNSVVTTEQHLEV